MADPSSSSGSSSSPSSRSSSGPTGSRLRRWARRGAWALGGLIGILLLLIGAFLLFLQTETGATATARLLAQQANPLPGTEIHIERASGSWIRSLRLTNVSLTRTDSTTGRTVQMAHVDTLAAQYRLRPLLQGRLHLTDVSMAAPSVTMRQAPDSSWDWARHLPTTEPSDDTSSFPIQVDRARLSHGAFTAEFHNDTRDSTAQIEDLRLLTHDVQTTPSITGRIDTLGFRGQLPADTTTLRLATRGGLSSTHLRLETLQFDSPHSHVRGYGQARLPDHPDDRLDDVDLTLRADPFAFRDVTAFVPTLDLDPQESIQLEAVLRGSGRRLTLTTDAAFSEGGTVSARAEATPTTEVAFDAAPLRYRLDAEIRNLTTSLLGPTNPAENQITASLGVDLDGQMLSSVDGSGDLHLEDTHAYGYHFPELSLTSTFRDGEALFDLQGIVNTASVSADGRVRPFDNAPSTTLTAHVQDLNVAAFAPDADLETAISATAQVEGRALGTPHTSVDALVNIAPSQVGVQPINDGRFTLTLQPDQVQFEGGLTFPAGRIQTSGHAALDDSEQFTLETGRFENFNVAALAGDTTDSRLTGTFHAEGRGFAPETMQLDATLSLRDSYYGPHQLNSLQTSVTLEDGRASTETAARLNGGSWSLAATGRPFDTPLTAEITRGRFQEVDIGPFLQDTTLSSQLHGTLRGTVEGSTPSALHLDAGLTLDTSQVNQQAIQSGSIDLRLQNGRLDTDLALDMPNGATRLIATAHPFEEVPTYRIREGTFENVNVGAFMGSSALTTRLTGSLTLQGRGTSLSTLSLDSELSVQDSQINQASLTDGGLVVSTENNRITTNGQFELASGHLRFEGQVDSLDSTPTYSFQTGLGSLDIGALAGLDTLSAHIDTLRGSLEGRGTDLETMTASAQLATGALHLDRFRINTSILAGNIRNGVLSLDTLTVQSNVFSSQGAGTLALTEEGAPSNFRLRTHVTDTRPLRRIVGARTFQLTQATLETRIYGRTNRQRFDGELEVEGLIYNDYRVTDVELTFNGQRGSDQLFQRLDVNGTFGYMAGPGLMADETRLNALYDGDDLSLSSSIRLDDEHTANLEATIQPGEEETVATLHQFNLQLGPDRWSLLQETSFTMGDSYRVNGFLLTSGSQQIAADGIVDPSGTQSLVVTIEDFRLGGVAPLMGLTGLDGTMTGTFDLSGAATDPQLDGRLDLELRSENQDVGTLRLDVGYDDFELALDARMTHTDGGVLTANGEIPADLRLQAPTPGNVYNRPVRLDLSTEQFPVNWIDPILDPSTARDVKGTLAADVEIRGTLDQPELAGRASLSGAGVYLPALETSYRNGAVSMNLKGDQLTLEKAVLQSTNGGRMRASGVIQFPQLTVGEFDLSLKASNFLAIDTRAYRRAIIDGNMTLSGTTQQPVLEGGVQIKSANVHYNEALAGAGSGTAEVSLTQGDQLTLEERFGVRLTEGDTTTFDTYDAMAMDLTVQIQRDTWLRASGNPEMNIQFTGDLDLSKEPRQDAQVFGSIQVVEGRSTIRQFGQEFQITEGSITFNGDPATPQLDLTAVYEQRAREAQGSEVRITLSVSGRPDNLTHDLQSDPQMDTRNILSYLATGRPADQLFSGGAGNGNLATQVALGQATNFVENLAASELGLDVVRLDFRTEGLSYLTVGRYVTPRFFVSIEQPVITSSVQGGSQTTLIPDLTLEYHLTDYLLLRSLSSQQSFQFNFLFEYSY